MITSIYFNNKNSYTDFGLFYEERPQIPLSYEDFETIEIEGRSGTLTRKLGTYKDKVITITFSVVNLNNFYRNLDDVIEWLNIIDNKELVFSFDMERKYIVKAIQVSDNIEQELDIYGKFQVTFVCEPFKYPISEELFISTSTSFTVFNFGSVKTEPYMKIYASGNITISVNGNTTIINSVDGYVELDSQYFLCHKGTTNKMLDMNGDFPILERGANNIVLTGTITSTEVNIRTKYR